MTVVQIIGNILDGKYFGNESRFESDLKNVKDITSSEVTMLRNKLKDSKPTGSTSSASKSISGLTNIADKLKSGIKTFGDMAFAIAYDQQNYDRSVLKVQDIHNAFDAVIDNGLNVFAQLGSALKGMTDVIDNTITETFEREGKLLESIGAKGGMAGDMARQFKNEIMEISPKAEFLGIKFGDIKDATETMLTNSQKFATYQGQTIYNALRIGAAYGQSAKALLENAEAFRNVGISLADSSNAIEDIGKKSLAQGLSARATTTSITSNIGKLNEYGFQNGVKGLANMVREAQSLKFNMEETFTVAKKLYDPEGAIDLAANLQVIGGAIGDLGDPIKLMYDATNNVESLQTSILDAAKSLATYNEEQGRFEVTGANLRRAKAMADALGISMGELTSAAIKGQAKMQALSEIELFDLDDDQKEFVSNLASMKNGVMGIEISKDMARNLNIKEGFVEFGNLTAGQMGKIAKVQADLAKQTPEQTIRDQYNVATRSLNVLNAIALSMGVVAKNSIENNPTYKKFVKTLEQGEEDVSKMTPDEINEKFQKYMEDMISPVGQIVEKFKDGAGEVIDGAKDLYQKGKKAAEENLPSWDTIKEEGKKAIDAAKQIFDLNVKVDINSSSRELSEMVVTEIEKTPSLKSELASALAKSLKNYV